MTKGNPLFGTNGSKQAPDSPRPLIVSAAEDLRCDLIVGKRGRGQFEEWLLGSSTKHVLAESPSDVAIVHA